MSITNLREYGDVDRVRADALALQDILDRQGSNFVIDCIAESVGKTVNCHNIDSQGVVRIRESLAEELREAINERT